MVKRVYQKDKPFIQNHLTVNSECSPLFFNLTQSLTNPLWHDRTMHLLKKVFRWGAKDQLVASFGQASLLRLVDGQLCLRGGNTDDHAAAKEWIALFCHEAVPRWEKPNVAP